MHGNTDAHIYNFTSFLCIEYNSVHIIKFLYTCPFEFPGPGNISLFTAVGVAGFVSQVDGPDTWLLDAWLLYILGSSCSTCRSSYLVPESFDKKRGEAKKLLVARCFSWVGFGLVGYYAGTRSAKFSVPVPVQ